MTKSRGAGLAASLTMFGLTCMTVFLAQIRVAADNCWYFGYFEVSTFCRNWSNCDTCSYGECGVAASGDSECFTTCVDGALSECPS